MIEVDTSVFDSGQGTTRPVGIPLRAWATAGEGAALAMLVGRAGTPWWQVARVVVVLVAFVGMFQLQRSGRRWLTGMVSVLVGLVGTTTGAAIGLMNLFKSGPPLSAIAGLLCLLIGVPLLVVGAVTLIRLMRGWWRLLAIPVILLVLQFLLLPLTVGIYAANVPPGSPGSATPAQRDLPFTTVSFRAADGTHLSGWYVPSTNGAAIVAVPGAGSTKSSMIPQAAVLSVHGYGVLLIDNRGHGASGGTAMDFGWWGESDLLGAVKYLEGRADIHGGRIGILGESMGGEEAIGALGHDRRVRAVVAEGVTGRTFADTARLGSGVQSLISRADSWISYTTAGLLSRAPEPQPVQASLRAARPRPALIIAGRDEIQAARFFRSSSPSNVTIWEMPDTAHTAGLATHPTQWKQHVLAFLAEHL